MQPARPELGATVRSLRSGTGLQVLTSPEASAGMAFSKGGFKQMIGELGNSPGVGDAGG